MLDTSLPQSAEFSTHQANKPNMMAWALAYARVGFHVIPCHEPIHDHPLGYVCTCELYRHSDRCREKHPHLYLAEGEHCRNAGKHPRGLPHGLKEATNDPDQVRAWWTKYPNANIGHVPGRAGLVMLDGDTYKREYAGSEMDLTAGELATLTARSGSGGVHLYYAKHDGATYTNAKGDLPVGVDVRGDNGYAILPPSRNLGGRYYWEAGQGIPDCPPDTLQALPQRIHDILAAASAKVKERGEAAARAATRWTGETTTAAVDLTRWRLSADVRRLIAQPLERTKRSEADAKVCTALVYAGASDTDILAVFEHYPIGTAGKFAERGRDYLALTIGSARTHAAAHPRPADIEDQIAAARAWLHSVDLADLVPAEKQCSAGYRTRERDLAVADAILEVFAGYGSLSGPLGLRQLRLLTNLGGLATVARALDNLTPWFVRPVETEDQAADGARVFELVRTWNTHQRAYVLGVPPTHKTFTEFRPHDAFNATTTPITPADIEDRAAAGNPYSDRYQATGIYKRRLAAALPGAGRTALVIVDALMDAGGDLALADLVGLGGRSRFTIRRAVDRLVYLDLVAVDGGQVALRPDWRAWLDAIGPLMPTAGNAKRRLVRDCVRTLEACDKRERVAHGAHTALPDWVHTRRKRARETLLKHAPTFYREHYSDDLRWDRREQAAEQDQANAAWRGIEGADNATRERMLYAAGYDAAQIALAARGGQRRAFTGLEVAA